MSEIAAGWDCHVHVFDAGVPVRPGHYQPADRPLAEIEATAAAHGVGHLVLVQPSVYGTDNTLLLRALASAPGRHRGVAVVDDTLDEAALDAMHALGVRGVRLNLVSPVGEGGDVEDRFARLAPRLRLRGWHVQWYGGLGDLARIARLHQGSGVTPVLDHLAGFTAGTPADHPGWQQVESLASQGAWLKLSGWYRLGEPTPHARLLPLARRLAGLFGDRVVWGSDWPHTFFPADALPAYGSTWQPVVEALGLAAAERLRRTRPALYD